MRTVFPIMARYWAGVRAVGAALLLSVPPGLLGAGEAVAHAIVIDSTPVADAAVKGPDLAIELRFNSRIDHERSRLTLYSSDGSSRLLTQASGVAPDVIAAKAVGLAPGAYRLHWQVLAVDGHITRGDIPFRVVAPQPAP
jgi:methionine-rich copper-binding protein CopC